jgi:hypothetical protein
MRKPSLHIGKDHLYKLIDEWFDKHKIGTPAELLVEHLLKNGKKYSLRHRSLLATNEKTKRRASRIESSPITEAMMFDSVCRMIRQTKLKHRGIKIVGEKDGAQWDFLLQATGLATEFCKEYNLNKKQGYIIYLGIALKEIKPFAYNRVKAAHSRIIAHYECMLEIEKDPNSDKSELIFDIYQQKVYEKTGINMAYRDVPYEFVHFVRAAKCSIEVGLHPKHYVIAQFEQLDFTNGYPTPSQLDTFKAKERAIRWATENDIKKREQQKNLTQAQLKFMKRHANNS